MLLYFSPTTYHPVERGIRPIDFRELVAVNPIAFCPPAVLYRYSAFLADASDEKGLARIHDSLNGKGFSRVQPSFILIPYRI